MCLVTFNQFCSNMDSPWGRPTEMRENALKFLVDNGHPHYDKEATWGRADHERIGTLCDTLEFDNQGYHIDWHGNYCGGLARGDVKIGRNEEDVLFANSELPVNDSYLQCNTHYPLVRIRDLLARGAKRFPKAQFEKVSPVERIWFGFEYQCKKGWRSKETGDSGTELWDECGKVFKKNSAESCARNTQKQMMLCFKKENPTGCTAILGEIDEDGKNLDKEADGTESAVWKTATDGLYNPNKSDDSCSLLNQGGELSRIARNKCKPMKLYKQCWNDKAQDWDKKADKKMTDAEKNKDFNGDGKVSAREKHRATQIWIRKQMAMKLNRILHKKLEKLNIRQVESSFGDEEPVLP